jgi:hypothetical protein
MIIMIRPGPGPGLPPTRPGGGRAPSPGLGAGRDPGRSIGLSIPRARERRSSCQISRSSPSSPSHGHGLTVRLRVHTDFAFKSLQSQWSGSVPLFKTESRGPGWAESRVAVTVTCQWPRRHPPPPRGPVVTVWQPPQPLRCQWTLPVQPGIGGPARDSLNPHRRRSQCSPSQCGTRSRPSELFDSPPVRPADDHRIPDRDRSLPGNLTVSDSE